MGRRIKSFVFAVMMLTLISATGAMAQQEHQHGAQKPPAQNNKQMDMQHGSMDMSAMMNEPHNLLAMAYVKNISTFAATLHEQAGKSSALDADLARAATAEIRRSFDAVQQHLQQHMSSMGGSMQSHSGMSHSGMSNSGMMGDSDAHIAAIKQHITALERDVQADTLNAKSIADHAAEIHKHADELSNAHGSHEGHKM